MKRILFSIIAVSMLFAGCAKQVDEFSDQDKTPQTIRVKSIVFSTQTLKFASMDELHDAITYLATCSAQQKQ